MFHPHDLCKGKGKVVPILNEAPRHEGVLGSGRKIEVSCQLQVPAALPPVGEPTVPIG